MLHEENESISAFSEDIDFELKNSTHVFDWIHSVVTSYQKNISEISYIFCSDEYLLNINREYLNHDYYTDIITFDNSSDEDELIADLFISIERVQDNATTYNVSFEDELHRVMIHGVLHLIGFADKTDEDEKIMRQTELQHLNERKFI